MLLSITLDLECEQCDTRTRFTWEPALFPGGQTAHCCIACGARLYFTYEAEEEHWPGVPVEAPVVEAESWEG